MISKISSSLVSFLNVAKSQLEAWCKDWAQQGCMYVPMELGPLMCCTRAALTRRFPPGKTHRSRIYAELGEPTLTISHHRSGTTIWHYRAQEYWVAHAPTHAPVHEVGQHELVLTFNAQGVLQGIERDIH